MLLPENRLTCAEPAKFMGIKRTLKIPSLRGKIFTYPRTPKITRAKSKCSVLWQTQCHDLTIERETNYNHLKS